MIHQCLQYCNTRMEHIKSWEVVQSLQAVVVAIGEDILGIKKEYIGMHSIAQFTQLWWSENGKATSSYITSESRWNNSATICPWECFASRHIDTSRSGSQKTSSGPKTTQSSSKHRNKKKCWWGLVSASSSSSFLSVQLYILMLELVDGRSIFSWQ